MKKIQLIRKGTEISAIWDSTGKQALGQSELIRSYVRHLTDDSPFLAPFTDETAQRFIFSGEYEIFIEDKTINGKHILKLIKNQL